MSVRAKMTCGYTQKGARGVSLNFSAVFEGSEELQAISENAIFGKATPSAFLNLVGPFDVERFKTNEEYYIEIWDCMDPLPHWGTPILATASATLVYRSELDPNYPDRHAFKYGFMAPNSGMLDLTILNKDAVDWLDTHDDFEVVIRLARGRRSDAEIAAIQKMLDVACADAGKMWDDVQNGGGSRSHWVNEDAKKVDRETWIAQRTAYLKRKLDIASGADMPA